MKRRNTNLDAYMITKINSDYKVRWNKEITTKSNVSQQKNEKLKTIGFSRNKKLEKVRCCASYTKKKEKKKQNTYNMAVKRFFGKNKEIFTHGSFVDIEFPCLFLPVSLRSRSQTFVQCVIKSRKTLWFLVPKPYGFFRLLWIIPFDAMTYKIYARRVMKMGREPRHSLMVTIPRKICNILQIEKGTILYFKLEGSKFFVSKDIEFLESTDDNNNISTVESMEPTKEKKMDINVAGVSLADLQY